MEKKLQEYKEGQIKLQRTLSISLALSTVLFLIISFAFKVEASATSSLTDFMMGFRIGLMLAVVIAVGMRLNSIRRALSDETILRQKFQKETDERTQMVAQKAAAGAMSTALLLLPLAALIASKFNAAVFFTLLACTFFFSFLKISFTLYYRKKY